MCIIWEVVEVAPLNPAASNCGSHRVAWLGCRDTGLDAERDPLREAVREATRDALREAARDIARETEREAWSAGRSSTLRSKIRESLLSLPSLPSLLSRAALRGVKETALPFDTVLLIALMGVWKCCAVVHYVYDYMEIAKKCGSTEIQSGQFY